MQKRKLKKGLIITLAILLIVITLVVILSFTLFSLKKVEVDYRTSHSSITLTNDEIIEGGKFKKGKSVFFHGKDKYIENIEKLDPYIEVINIETVFPSKFVIHIAERQEVYALEGLDNIYICDKSMKVLRICESIQETDAILLKPEAIIEGYSVGQTISLKHKENLFNALYENNRTLGQQRAMIEKIELISRYDSVLKRDQSCTRVTFKNGQTYILTNDSYAMKYKAKMMLDIFSQYHNFVGKESLVKIGDEEKKVILTEEMLESATFVISNYYDYTSHTSKDCYFSIELDNKNIINY